MAILLGSSPEFSARWRICYHTNYTRESIPQAEIENVTLFLYQHLGPHYGELSSERMLARVNPAATRLCIPNMSFHGYWPTLDRGGPMIFSDFLLDRLYESGAGKQEILALYLKGRLAGKIDLDAKINETLQTERTRESLWDVKVVDLVEENWRKEKLFQTYNHPGERLLLLVAQTVLGRLGLPPLAADFCASFRYDYEGFHQPIHPQVGAHFGLPFISEDTRYPVFGREMTFAQYVSRYIDCRINGLEDVFLGYLQMI